MRYFHGKGAKDTFFEGWYFKLVDSSGSIAFIPSVNRDKNGTKTATIQIVTKEKTFSILYPYEEFFAHEKRLYVKIGRSVFSAYGCFLNIKTADFSCMGKVLFTKLRPPKKKFMGYLKVFSSLECYHEVLSLNHFLNGRMVINDRSFLFDQGFGYIATSYGSSFPKNYMSFQCNSFNSYIQQRSALLLGVDLVQNLSVTAIVAHVSLQNLNLQGFVAIVHYQNFEYKFSLYNGAKLVRFTPDAVIFKRGIYELYLYPEPQQIHALSVPYEGALCRSIDDTLACNAKVELWRRKKLIFRGITDTASFEFIDTAML